MQTVSIMLTHVTGGPHFTGHSELADDVALQSVDPHRVDVSVSFGPKGAFRHIGSAERGGQPLLIPGTTIRIPYQLIEDQLVFTLITG